MNLKKILIVKQTKVYNRNNQYQISKYKLIYLNNIAFKMNLNIKNKFQNNRIINQINRTNRFKKLTLNNKSS